MLAQVGVVVEIPFEEAATPREAAAPGRAEVVGVIVDAVVPVMAEDFAGAPKSPSSQ